MGLNEEKLQPLVTAWRNSNPNLVKFWRAADNAVMTAISKRASAETHGLKFAFKSGMLFITLLSGRKLACVKPHIGMNQLCGKSIPMKAWEQPRSGNVSRTTAPSLWKISFRQSNETFSAMPCRHSGSAIW